VESLHRFGSCALMENVIGLDSLIVNWNLMDWKQIIHTRDFRWIYGQTPLSHIQVPLAISILYLVSIYTIQSAMKERKPYSLKIFTFVHNVFLTVLSTMMFIGTAYGAYLKFQAQGFFEGLVCEQEDQPIHGVMFYWSYIFYLSKFYELVDSFLLVLKKKPLIFLHVFHHFVMPYVCWAGLEGKWCMALWTSAFWNSFVHIWMYYYYSVSTLGYSPWWKKYLTGLQIYQFVSGVLYTTVYFYYYFGNLRILNDDYTISFNFDKGCTGDLWAVVGMFAVNCSFLYLFSKFFKDHYLQSRRRSRQQKDA